ncbi:hypothetical protein MVES1_001553 [Malassezia vespertilionis]|uniref:SIS domain-containing protein n=1 Tax=Malassezia vespertilionis TaxID=2020962 RepID=A0A2N1JCV6_9BASI|nr:uncharacterized protein MVES1_001553 [Malassezia vespertilionis]PKI84400.1 hypothetical protein MVES_001463 [Malassezia vespertilionis]WFD06211.1 hypothetical protein MVES1_001553 [Malassezia vespertilionis]
MHLGADTPELLSEVPLSLGSKSLDAALDVAILVVQREADALQHVSSAMQQSPRMQSSFRRALQLLLQKTRLVDGRPLGKVVVVGIGKSGIIGQKIVSMLLSLDTQAVFLHPADALHGDLGMINSPHDVILSLSYSGNSPEIVAFMELEPVRRCARIALAGNEKSTLVQQADVWLDCSIPGGGATPDDVRVLQSEAYPNIPAPTTSTTIMLALGDALAMSLTQAKGIEKSTFMKNHPGGSLGRMFK